MTKEGRKIIGRYIWAVIMLLAGPTLAAWLLGGGGIGIRLIVGMTYAERWYTCAAIFALGWYLAIVTLAMVREEREAKKT